MPASFRPSRWTSGGHRQTLLGYLRRRSLAWGLASEDVVVPGEGDGVRLLVRASFQPGPRDQKPLLVLVHGLGGNDSASYLVATGLHAFAHGWNVARMNLRGAGDSEALCPLFYNAGLHQDLFSVACWAGSVARRVAIVGFSLGGNVLLLTLARERLRLPAAVRAACAISAPLDLAACADALGSPRNRLYQAYFMRDLRRVYRRRHLLRPDLFAAARERGTRTIWDYDDAITAPLGGYASAADYYARSSAGQYLTAIAIPTLVLAAGDDPMIPVAAITRWPLSQHGPVRREITPTGGHVGFVAPTSAPGGFWAAERALHFLGQHVWES